ncbi:NrdH-redoxin [Methanomicrobiaceae archaeon CYW5]|uniref:glutaredoxin family protein n=1 Tax=Methanovulcanius yangii TaxID=1789227 RepID=UPI0029CA6645|nr:glutaredoxin family protein [Methanovulcanius yangii]MBT8507644.1 NrdH-redoxin [Methanovulcanius yangii]
MELIHVDGENVGPITLYALSTCGHCRRTRQYLGELGVAYDYIEVDLLHGEAFDEAYDLVKKYNPRGSFPTIVIGEEETVIIGERLDEIRAAIGK